jgi:hypothetical protein
MVVMQKEILTYKYGYLFPTVMLIFGLFFIGVNFQNIPTHKTGMKIFLMLLGLGIVLSRHGLQIDVKKKRMRKYISFLGWKFAKWESYDSFPNISVIYDKKKVRFAGRSNVSFGDVEESYKVVLLSENHFRKKELYVSDSFEQANEKMKEYSYDLKVGIVKFSPKLSMSTLLKRRL